MELSTEADGVIQEALRIVAKHGLARRAEARNRVNIPVNPLKETAKTFSITGALYLASQRLHVDWFVPYDQATRFLDDIVRGRLGMTLLDFNDNKAQGAQDFLALLPVRRALS